MNYLLIVIASAICALSSATQFHFEGVPVGHEQIFDYQAIVHVGTKQPAHFASTFRLKGHIHYQKIKDDLAGVYLTDLEYNLYNGPITADHYLHNETWGAYLPIPEAVHSLTKPFQIVYNNGKLSELILDQTDKEFAMNMKKSIASILQVDKETVGAYTGKGYVKMVPEDTVYGVCHVKYHLIPKGNVFVLAKSFEPEKCENHFNLRRNKNFMTFDNSRIYKFEKDGDKVRIHNIESFGHIITYPQGGLDGHLFTKTYQRFSFHKEETASKHVEIEKKHVVKSLKYSEPFEKCRELPLNTLLDITGGRREYPKSEVLITRIHDLLTKLNNYLKENHINFEKPTFKHSKYVHLLLLALEDSELDTLQQSFNLLQEKSASDPEEKRKMYLFVQLLPHVGTTFSAILIRNLIRKDKIDPYLAIMILKDLPAHLKCPNEKLLTELEDLLTLHKDNPFLHNALVLTYASLVGKTYAGFDEKSPVLEKHINYFMEQLKSTKDTNLKVLYVQALSNIRIGSVFEHLKQLAVGDVEVEENVRLLALQAIAPHLRKDVALMYKIVMPILINRELSIGLRATAYMIYINVNPSYGSFMKLYQIFKRESNERFYSFHYNTLKSMSKLKPMSSFEGIKSKLANMLLRISRHPVDEVLVDGSYYNEYTDEEYDFGTQIRHTVVDNGHDVLLHSRMLTQLNGHSYEMFTIYLRIIRQHKGSDPFGIKTPVPDEKKGNSPFALNTAFELVLHRDGRTIMTYAGDVITVDVIRSILRNFNILFGKDFQFPPAIQIPFLYERILPTDMGLPIIFTEHVPITHSIHMEVSGDGEVRFDLRLALLANRNLHMEVYNPVADLYHGITDTRSIAFNLPLSIMFKKTDDDVVLTFLKNKEGAKGGLQTYSTTKVYVLGDHAQEMLGKFHKDQKMFQEVVGSGMEYKKKIPLLNVKLNGIGKHVEAAIFECERNVSRGTFIYQHFGEDDVSAVTDDELLLELDFMVLYQYMLLTPSVGACGFNIEIDDLPEVDHVELKLDLGADINFGLNEVQSVFSNIKLNVGGQLTAKSADNQALTTHILSAETDINLGELAKAEKINFFIKYMLKEKEVVKSELGILVNHQRIKNTYDTKFTFDVGKEKAVMELDIKTLRSEEQERMAQNKNFIYNECYQEVYRNQILLPYSQSCARAAATLNKHSIDLLVKNYENNFVLTVAKALQAWKSRYALYRQPFSENIIFGHNKEYHIDLVFPVFRDEIDLAIKTDKHEETYKGIPNVMNGNWFMLMFDPFFVFDEFGDSHTSSEIFEDYTSCLINHKYLVTNKYNIVKSQISGDYGEHNFMEGLYENGTRFFAVQAKTLDNTGLLGFKIQIGDHESLEGAPTRTGYNINGKEITPEMGKQEINDEFIVVVTAYPSFVLIAGEEVEFKLTFDGKTIRLNVPHGDTTLGGMCVESEKDQVPAWGIFTDKNNFWESVEP